jgi:Fic family protein
LGFCHFSLYSQAFARPGAELSRFSVSNRYHGNQTIENNTLTLEQVTAVINGKHVLGHPREIQEVRNALAAYDAMEGWAATSRNDLLTAYRLLMSPLVDDAGCFRSGGVGVFRGEQLVQWPRWPIVSRS